MRDLGMDGSGRRRLFVRGPRGLEPLLAEEIAALGGEVGRRVAGGVAVDGDLALGYRLCYGSRLATRVLWPLASFPADDADGLYAGVAALPWPELIAPEATLAVGFDGRSRTLHHTGFAARRVKDAVVDSLRAATGRRPAVELDAPDVRLQAVLHRGRVTLHLDLAGEVLHRRGWRTSGGEAPLKENLAAGMLLAAGWPALAASGATLLDPLCGSGTLLVEGARIAARIPAGAGRRHWGFLAWRGHRPELWAQARAELDGERRTLPCALVGRDADPEQIERTRDHLRAAGLDATAADLRTAELDALAPRAAPGLVVANPPYGVRLAGGEPLLRRLGAVLRGALAGWHVALLVGGAARTRGPAAAHAEREQVAALDLPGLERRTLYNGAIRCQLLTGCIAPGVAAEEGAGAPGPEALGHARMFANRLRKNRRRLERWARDRGAGALRLYDRDLPEYAFAVDRYRAVQDASNAGGAEGGGDTGGPEQAGEEASTWLCVQEYAPPGRVDPVMAARRRAAALAVLPEATAVPAARTVLKTRRRASPREQYPRLARQGRRLLVEEEGARLEVNLTDFIDTGLFLDSRPLRRRLRHHFAAAGGGDFLNLFAYTCTATVHAALGGAGASTSVDLSPAYLAWGERNLAHNALDAARHRCLRADVPAWLADPARRHDRGRYHAILLDAPTYSVSKRAPAALDVQRDHPALLAAALALLAPGGELIFCTHLQRFRLRFEPPSDCTLRPLDRRELDLDFQRGRAPHRAWVIRRR